MKNSGAVFVRINNPILLRVLKEYEKVCPDVGCLVDSKGYDIEYGDLFYVNHLAKCPSSLDELTCFFLDLIDDLSDKESFDEFAEKIRNMYSEVLRGYSYVQWIYTPCAEKDGMPDSIVYTYGEDSILNAGQVSTLKVRISSCTHGGMMAAGFRHDLFDYFYDSFEDNTYFMVWYENYTYRDNPRETVAFEDDSWDIVDIDIYIRFEKPVYVDVINKVVTKLHRDFGYHIACKF